MFNSIALVGGTHGNADQVPGGGGGNGTGGDINTKGGNGGNGWNDFNWGGNRTNMVVGGTSYWGGGGRGSCYNSVAPEPGQAYGSGGRSTTPVYGTNGAGGKQGIVVVEEYA